MNLAPREFWEDVHERDDLWFLCKSSPHDVLQQHGLDLPKNLVVCDIGVGNGDMSRLLCENGNDVTCVDISVGALAKCDDRAKKVPSPGLSGPFDLVICHLVAQHCDDEELGRLLSSIRLKEDGRISIQQLHGPSSSACFPQFIRTTNQFMAIAEGSGRVILDYKGVWSDGTLSWIIWKLK